MNPEVIIVFVVLIVINSIFNKNRVQKKQQQRRNQQNQQQFGQSGPKQKQSQADSRDSGDYGLRERRETSSPEKKEELSQPKPQQQRPRSLLEEVLQQYNINEEAATQKPKVKAPPTAKAEPKKSEEEKAHYTDYSDRDKPQKSRKKKVMKSYTKSRAKGIEAGELTGDFFEKDSVEKSEIGIDNFDELLTFDQKSLVQGIIMAEILQKPKALTKKKAS